MSRDCPHLEAGLYDPCAGQKGGIFRRADAVSPNGVAAGVKGGYQFLSVSAGECRACEAQVNILLRAGSHQFPPVKTRLLRPIRPSDRGSGGGIWRV